MATAEERSMITSSGYHCSSNTLCTAQYLKQLLGETGFKLSQLNGIFFGDKLYDEVRRYCHISNQVSPGSGSRQCNIKEATLLCKRKRLKLWQ
jgi:hypothetical protein